MTAYADYLKSEEWIAVSSQRRDIDGNACVCCGSGQKLDVHHVYYPSNWYETDVDCLRTVCHDCHLVLHRMNEVYDKYAAEWESTKNGFLVEDGPYELFKKEVVKLVAQECWSKNRFALKSVIAWVRELEEIIKLDKCRYNYYISTCEVMNQLAFVKDCYIRNKKPVFNEQKRKARARSKTRFK